MGKVPLMTLMTAMTMNCRGSLNRMGHSPEVGGSMRSTSATKSDADVKLDAIYLFPNISPCSYRKEGVAAETNAT
jgi:hypothetical protein